MSLVYHEEGISDAVNFKLSPGIRGPEHTGSGYRCVDERNCDAEVYFLCAQAQNNSDAIIHYLDCVDSSSDPAATAAEDCAGKCSLPWDAITNCFKGDQGQTLKKNAALHFDKRFPNPVGVPHIEIDGVAQSDRSEATLLKNLCATGIKAAACSKDTVIV